jgi:hypothetical protein
MTFLHASTDEHRAMLAAHSGGDARDIDITVGDAGLPTRSWACASTLGGCLRLICVMS